MEMHRKLSDVEFETQFLICQMRPEHFTHEAHLRLAWINLQKYGVAEAAEKVQWQLKNYVNFLGVSHKYNTTLTVAAVRAVYHFKAKSKALSFEDFVLEFPRLQHNFKDLMASHYSFDIYNSEKARNAFLEPDLLPFDL